MEKELMKLALIFNLYSFSIAKSHRYGQSSVNILQKPSRSFILTAIIHTIKRSLKSLLLFLLPSGVLWLCYLIFISPVEYNAHRHPRALQIDNTPLTFTHVENIKVKLNNQVSHLLFP